MQPEQSQVVGTQYTQRMCLATADPDETTGAGAASDAGPAILYTDTDT